MEAVCHHCSKPGLELVGGFERFRRVTSDCKPWPAGGRLARCPGCGLVQTPVTPEWREECDRIYRGYTIYHQSGGSEQPVFQSGGGQASARSRAILDALHAHCPLPAAGRWLDVGCGNGSFLRVASAALSGWTFVGTEFDGKYRREVESIPRVERLHTGALTELEPGFDAVSLVHVLEHIPGPAAMLQSAYALLKPGGLLVVEVPDCTQNPFMLLVADHCSHFGPSWLGALAAIAGGELLHSTHQWIPKEITVVARKPEGGSSLQPPGADRSEAGRILAGVDSLHRLLDQARAGSAQPGFGLFGTSIAATWLMAELDGAPRFFVDEDPGRRGREHLGRPILAPSEVPAGSRVFVALPSSMAARVAARLQRSGVEYLIPVA